MTWVHNPGEGTPSHFWTYRNMLLLWWVNELIRCYLVSGSGATPKWIRQSPDLNPTCRRLAETGPSIAPQTALSPHRSHTLPQRLYRSPTVLLAPPLLPHRSLTLPLPLFFSPAPCFISQVRLFTFLRHCTSHQSLTPSSPWVRHALRHASCPFASHDCFTLHASRVLALRHTSGSHWVCPCIQAGHKWFSDASSIAH